MLSLMDAFATQKRGLPCKKCGALVPVHYIQRHKGECFSNFDRNNGDDSDIEVMDVVMNLAVKQGSQGASKSQSQEVKATLIKTSPGTLKRPPPVYYRAEINNMSPEETYRKCVDMLSLPVDLQKVHYSVRLFKHICNTVLQHQLTDEPCCSFWAPFLSSLFTFLRLEGNEEGDDKDVALWLCQNGRRWHVPSRLSIRNREHYKMDKIFRRLYEQGLLISLEEEQDVDLRGVIDVLCAEELKKFCQKMKLNKMKNKSEEEKSRIIEELRSRPRIDGSNVEESAFKAIRSIVGPIYRLDLLFYQFVISFCTVYSPFTMDAHRLFDDEQLVLIRDLLYELYKVEGETESFMYSHKQVNRIKGVYRDFNDFMMYISLKMKEMDCAALHRRKKHEQICNGIEMSAGELKKFLKDEDGLLSFYKNVPGFLLKYTCPAILIRIMMHGIEAAQKLKRYDYACDAIAFLLLNSDLDRFYSNRKGFLIDRLVLNLQSHLKNNEYSFKFCSFYVKDDRILKRYTLQLQDRAIRLAKTLKIEFRPVIELLEPEIIEISATTLSKDLGNGRINMFMNNTGDNMDYCSVEQIALMDMVNNQGYEDGFHIEGGVWHTLYGLACFDIIFENGIYNAWVSELQTRPMDQNSQLFYTNRKDLFEKRFNEIENDRDRLCEIIKQNFELYMGTRSADIDWNTFNMDDNRLWDILECVDLQMLTNLFRRFAADYRNSRSGLPDLTVWNKTEKRMAVVEVKGPGDKLSTKQRLWLDFFVRNSTRAVVCRVSSRSARQIT
ncbi:unnamed protein product [Bursaphelenchus okinawaensis]|uniref:Fanconi-associated nuclease n=1 Tax=Bursaphelenchus okinawaensis TaxID=465554 RepID=A0A811L439_9BILA|nr:unnamed protein product [Bursaphelenchus okinawaensis]CAG9116927.1 unnamed protein product [Bursaphelenchus okinawaensis]